MLRTCLIILSILLLASISYGGEKTETFLARGFSISYPDNWITFAKGRRDLLSVVSPDKSKSLFITGFRLPGDGGDEMALQFRNEFLTELIVKGWHVTEEGKETISGINFKITKAQVGSDNAVFFETSHGNEHYLIREILKGGFPRLDPQLQEIIESFKIL
jgi:hypothetical protein